MKEQIMAFLRDEEGLTMVEYAAAGALITVAAVAAFASLGDQIGVVIGNIETAITPAG